MDQAPAESRPRNLIPLGIAFEAALGFMGVALATALHVPLERRLDFSIDVLWRTAAALAPMLAFLFLSLRSRWSPLRTLREQVERLVREFFGRATWAELAAVSIAAGVGEEVLFRGALQPLAIGWTGSTWAGVALVSLLFGLAHAASALYFVLATAIGLYLGWITEKYDDLATPIIVHAAYDLAALMLLRNGRRADSSSLPNVLS